MSDGQPTGDDLKSRLAQAIKSAENLASELDKQSAKLTRSGRRNFLFDRWFRSVVAILSVASPTLVAFQSARISGGG